MHTKRFANHVDHFFGEFGEQLEKQYGFLAYHTKPLWYNIKRHIGKMEVAELESTPKNMMCHSLLRLHHLPVGNTNSLRVGVNYFIKSDTTTKITTETFERVSNDICRRYKFNETLRKIVDT